MQKLVSAIAIMSACVATACSTTVDLSGGGKLTRDDPAESPKESEVKSVTATGYNCDAGQVGASFHEERAVIRFNGVIWSLPKVGSATGETYEGPTIAGPMRFSINGDDAVLQVENGLKTNCIKADFDVNELPDLSTLSSKEWSVEDMNGAGVIDNFNASLSFDGLNVAGSTGCNRFSGAYIVDGEALKFSPLATTRRACPPAIMDLEQKFLKTLRDPVDVSVDETGALLLKSASGTIRAR